MEEKYNFIELGMKKERSYIFAKELVEQHNPQAISSIRNMIDSYKETEKACGVDLSEDITRLNNAIYRVKNQKWDDILDILISSADIYDMLVEGCKCKKIRKE